MLWNLHIRAVYNEKWGCRYPESVCQSTRCKTACLSRLLGARRSKLPFIHESNAFASWEMLAKMTSDPLRLNCFGLHSTKALCSMKNDNMKRTVHVEASQEICHLIISEQLRADWGWEEEFLFWNDRAGDSTKWGAVTVCVLFHFKGPPHYQSWTYHALS